MVTIYCKTCGKSMTVYPSIAKTKKYCSRDCMAAGYTSPKVMEKCKRCRKEIELSPSHIGRKRYCSKQCMAIDKNHGKSDITLICKQCGGEYNEKKDREDRSSFCSKKCQNDYNRGRRKIGKIKKKCTNCGKEFLSYRDKKKKCCSRECAKERKATANRYDSKVVIRCDECGKNIKRFPSRIKEHNYCSRKCKNIGNGKLQEGIYTASKVVSCDGCGKEFRRSNSRLEKYEKAYCSMQCYQMNSSIESPTSIEIEFSNMLDRLEVPYEFQVEKGGFIVDFLVNGRIYVEINGCYWHGCSICFDELNKTQKRKKKRDRMKRAAFKKMGLPFVEIWEHEFDEMNVGDKLNL